MVAGFFLLNQPIHLFLGEKWKKQNLKVFKSGHPDRSDAPVETVECTKTITMLQVLTHTSGISYGFDAAGVLNPVDRLLTLKFQEKFGGGEERDSFTLESMCDALAEVPLVFTPGTQWHYGYNTDICARLVEVISGMRFSDYLQENIFSPLGMTDTRFHTLPQDRHRLADCFVEMPNKPLGQALVNISTQTQQKRYLSDSSPPFESGGGGLYVPVMPLHVV